MKMKIRQIGGLLSAVSACVLTLLASPQGRAADEDSAAKAMIKIPAGVFTPLMRNAGEPKSVPVGEFYLESTPVTNAQYLEFVQANPKWQRSRVSRLFADESYLKSWDSDVLPGSRAPLDAPVVNVSWFAARAYARWRGLRLPTTAEWERAAAPGYVTDNGKNEPAFQSDLYAWISRPTPEQLPAVAHARRNQLGVAGLHGLVWEWVEDFNTALVTGESRADTGLERNLFCGAGASSSQDTSDYAAFMRTALRSSLKANNTTSSLGFRCATTRLRRSCCSGGAVEEPTSTVAALPSRSSIYAMDAKFTDDDGNELSLAALRGRPVVIAMFFASCTYACPMLVADMAKVRAALPAAQRDRVAFVLVSFDPARDMPDALKSYRESRELGADWKLLTGKSVDIAELAAVLGVKYTLQADGQFAHSNLLTVLNLEGEIVHQRAGLNGDIEELARVLRGLAPSAVTALAGARTPST
jgi:formylglycine-generating enzyme